MKIHPYFEKMKSVMGGDAWDAVESLRICYKLSQGGLKGTLEQLRCVITGRYVETFKLGILSGGEGLDSISPWSSDSSKVARREQHPDSFEGAANCAYLHCMAYWYPDRWKATIVDTGILQEEERTYHRLLITPEGGRAFEYWIDCDTSLLDRTVENTAFQKITRHYSDYRELEGLLIPHNICTSVGASRYDRVCEVEYVDINLPVTDCTFEPPLTVTNDLIFENISGSCQIKFQLLSDLILIDVSVNGNSPLPFILDSGGVNILTPETANQLGLQPEGLIWGFGAGKENVDMQVTATDSLSLGAVTLRNQVVYVYPFPELKDILNMEKFGGLMGYELFRRAVIKIDYQQKMLTFTHPDLFHYDGTGTVVPFLFNHNIPEVKGVIDGIEGSFGVDTGNTGALILNSPFVKNNDLLTKYHPDDHTLGVGAGRGNAELAIGHASLLQLGNVQVHDLAVGLSKYQGGALSNPYSAGLLGAGVFQRFLVTFDYSRQQIIFENHPFAQSQDS